HLEGATLLLVGLRRSFTAGLSASLVQRLSGGASRLAALRLPANTPGIATPPCTNRTVGARAWSSRHRTGVPSAAAALGWSSGRRAPKFAEQLPRTGQQ